MIIIDEVLVSDEIIEEHFACQLSACKGACCIEGDFGAPLEEEEIGLIEENLNEIKKCMEAESIQMLETSGFSTYDEDRNIHETKLMQDGACVFMGRDRSGISFCAIERANDKYDTGFKKPLSCHLYPVRLSTHKETGLDALNYDRWDICSAACSNGTKKQVRIFEFVQDALIRKYGKAFYQSLAALAGKHSPDS